MDDELRLMLIWRQHHEALGLDLRILSAYHAQKHPNFTDYARAVDRITQNPGRGESRATFMRWLAVSQQGSCPQIMMQYNVFLYPSTWADLDPVLRPIPADLQSLFIFQGTRPSLVMGTKETFERQCKVFIHCKVKDAPVGVTDDRILEAQLQPGGAESLLVRSISGYVKDYGEPGWETACAVRYPRVEMAAAGHGVLWKDIPTLRKRIIPA